MKKTILISISVLLLGCTKKITETRVEQNVEQYKECQVECMSFINAKDSASIKYYEESCRKDCQTKTSIKQQYVIYKRGNKIIKEVKLK